MCFVLLFCSYFSLCNQHWTLCTYKVFNVHPAHLYKVTRIRLLCSLLCMRYTSHLCMENQALYLVSLLFAIGSGRTSLVIFLLHAGSTRLLLILLLFSLNQNNALAHIICDAPNSFPLSVVSFSVTLPFHLFSCCRLLGFSVFLTSPCHLFPCSSLWGFSVFLINTLCPNADSVSIGMFLLKCLMVKDLQINK